VLLLFFFVVYVLKQYISLLNFFVRDTTEIKNRDFLKNQKLNMIQNLEKLLVGYIFLQKLNVTLNL
jgi:hypothetical protein